MTNVLLVGPWAPASLAFARSVQRHGIDAFLLQPSTSQQEQWTLSGLRGSATIPASFVGTPEGIDWIKRYASDIGAAALVAITDRELLWLGEHRHEFEPSCKVLVQNPDSLSRLLSKTYQLELAGRAGLSILPTYLLLQAADADSIPGSDFPLAIRPDRPDNVEPRFKVRLVKSREQLRTVVNACRSVASPIIAQPFKNLPNLVVHGVRSVTGDTLGSQCYAVPRKFEGVTLALERCAFPNGLEEACRRFAALADISGCYHLEFLFSHAENLASFLEVNVRLGGTTDKVVRMGFDEPSLLLQAYGISVRPTASAASRPRRVVNKRVLLKHIVWAASGKLTELDYPHVGRLTHIAYSCRDLILAKDSIFDWRDAPGSIKFHLRGLTGGATGV